jgi:hypothetical protein
MRLVRERGTHPLIRSISLREEEGESVEKISEQARTANHWLVREKDLFSFLFFRPSQWCPVYSKQEMTSR